MDETQKAAWNAALRLLTRREYSQLEIARKLQQKGFAEDIVDAVLAQLQSAGYQSDARFAEHYIRHRSQRGYGPRRIRMELKEKGVSAELIEQSLDTAEVDWFELVSRVHGKKFDQAASDWPEKARQIQFLDYRGFTRDQIDACVEPGHEID